MKEYLTKNSIGNYQLVNHRFSEDDITVPEGAEILADTKNGLIFYKKHDDRFDYCLSDEDDWAGTFTNPYDEIGAFVDKFLWQRSLNGKVASAEVARQKHSHYKKDVSHLKTIDVYRVIDLFEVESNALGHAIKKLLCSGQRGAKDHKQDIQEAIDSLNRHLEMLAEDEAS